MRSLQSEAIIEIRKDTCLEVACLGGCISFDFYLKILFLVIFEGEGLKTLKISRYFQIFSPRVKKRTERNLEIWIWRMTYRLFLDAKHVKHTLNPIGKL